MCIINFMVLNNLQEILVGSLPLIFKKLLTKNIGDSLRVETRNLRKSVQLQILFRTVNEGWESRYAKVEIHVEQYNYRSCFTPLPTPLLHNISNLTQI